MNKKIIALDIGLKRIGVAYSPFGGIVVPMKPIFRKNRTQAAAEVDQLLNQWNIDLLVVGLPKTNQEMEKRIRHFISLLKWNGPIEFVDESFTSKIVEEEIKGVIKYKRDGRIDSLSAQKILTTYLSRHSNPII